MSETYKCFVNVYIYKLNGVRILFREIGMLGPTVSPPPAMLLAVYFPSLSFHWGVEMQKQDHRAGN
jgi:hypothetical protein